MTTCVFLAHSAADSGAEQSLLTCLSLWPDGESRPLFVLAEDGPIVDRGGRLGVDITVAPLHPIGRGLRRDEKDMRRILKALLSLVGLSSRVTEVLTDSHADVVVAMSLKSLVYGLVAGRRARTKVVWSVQDRISSDYFPGLVVPVLRHVLPRLVDGIMVNSRSTLSTLRPGRTPVLIATPAMALEERDHSGPADPVRSVVMLGRLAPWKAQDNFLEAFAEVFRDSGTRAVVVGGALFGETDYERSLVRLAAELEIAHQVRFTGHVGDVWPYLADADILVHCSRTPEPFGQVVVQGMWSRCAVIATTPGGPAEVITDHVNGLLVPCDDVVALSGALYELRDNAELRSRLAEEGRSSAKQYDATNTAPRVAEWLTLLVRNGLERGSVRHVQCGAIDGDLA